MVGHGEVADPDAHLVIEAHVERVDGGKHPAVPAPDVEVQHGVDLGCAGTGLHIEGIEQEAEVAVHLADVGVLGLGMGDPETHHAHGHLHHFVRVRVVHEGARAACHEFVHLGLADRNRFLGQARHAVHAVGQALAVPVDAGVLGQFVGDEDAHAVALNHLNGRARALAVVAPHVDLEAG